MAKGTYTYEPGNITTAGLDLMRFELGDTMVEGGADTCALTDEPLSGLIFWSTAGRKQRIQTQYRH